VLLFRLPVQCVVARVACSRVAVVHRVASLFHRVLLPVPSRLLRSSRCSVFTCCLFTCAAVAHRAACSSRLSALRRSFICCPVHCQFRQTVR
jgi:hypothetical protein